MVDEGSEFRVTTEWDSMEAIKEFAGPDPDVAVVPPEVEEMMVSFDRRVRHYDVVRGGLDEVVLAMSKSDFGQRTR